MQCHRGLATGRTSAAGAVGSQRRECHADRLGRGTGLRGDQLKDVVVAREDVAFLQAPAWRVGDERHCTTLATVQDQRRPVDMEREPRVAHTRTELQRERQHRPRLHEVERRAVWLYRAAILLELELQETGPERRDRRLHDVGVDGHDRRRFARRGSELAGRRGLGWWWWWRRFPGNDRRPGRGSIPAQHVLVKHEHNDRQGES